MSRRVLALLWPHRREAGLAALLQAATVASGISLMAISGWLLSAAALHPSIAALQLAIVGVRFFGIARGVLRYLERLASHDLTLRLLARLRASVYRSLEPLAPARLVAARSGDLLGRLVADVETLENVYVRVLGPTLSAVVVAGLVAAALFTRSAALAGAALLGFVLAGLVAPSLAWRAGLSPGRRLVTVRAELSARLVDMVQGLPDLLAYGRGPAHVAAVEADSRAIAHEQARLARASGLAAPLAGLLADLTALSVLVIAVPAVGAGRLEGVQLAALALLTLASFEAVAGLPAAFQGLGATDEAARRLFALTDAAPSVVEPAAPLAPGPGRSLEVRDLRFTYPDGTPALDGLSLSLAPGRLVALVGPSGCGKSTLVQLILRFWEVPEGTLFLDDQDVRALASDEVRARVSWAAQKPHVFTGTVRDNLLLARPRATPEELAAAVGRARLDGVIAALPQGYDTWLGEQGVRLSGGERQRLSLARAFLKGVPFLLLDEPTAHLDALLEREVLGEIARLKAAKGILLVTHRLAGLEVADEVIVLDRGRVAERGTVAALAAAGGRFARLLGDERAASALDPGLFA